MEEPDKPGAEESAGGGKGNGNGNGGNGADGKGGSNGKSTAADLLTKLGQALVPVLITAGSLLGFVAFAGAVIVWTRFFALDVPADQAVKAVPRSELVATGSSVLLLFGFFGVLAALALFLVDRGGRATPGMSRALVVLTTLEGGVAILIVTGVSTWQRVLAAVLLAIPACIVFAATFARRLMRFEDTHRPREGEILKPEVDGGLLRRADGKLRVSVGEVVAITAPLVAAAVLVAALLYFDLPAWVRVLGFVVAVLVVLALDARGGSDTRAAIAESVDHESVQEEALVEDELRDHEDAAEKERLSKRRPYRLVPNLLGSLIAGALTLAAIAFPTLLLHEWWLVVALGSAAVLGFGLWRIAGLSKPNFMWFGLAVFLSVPLFGTLSLMARNFADPQVQPMALIRNTDGPDEAIQGLYVTEADDRVYFANVATEGCGNRVTAHSGRLLWVPKKEVVAMSIGPLQDVKDAGKSALEMAYALTPAVETPAAGPISLTAEEARSAVETPAAGAVGLTVGEARSATSQESEPKPEPEPAGPQRDQRLENAGPAVRPNFGSGLRLVPEIASPGDEVALRMSLPNPSVHGFGSIPEGHTLRLNGVPLRILREEVLTASEAEFVKGIRGRVLSLDKKGVYVETGRHHHVLHSEYRGRRGSPRFVRLEGEHGSFLRLAKGVPGLVGGQVATLEDESKVQLRNVLLRQAWDEDEVRFRVPEHASSGVVTVECEQLAGQPLLRVSNPPVARIAMRMQDGSEQVVFDGRGSRGEGDKPVTARWTVGRRSLGRRRRVSITLPPRLAPYRVRLTVTDLNGKVDTAELILLRLPASFFEVDKASPLFPERIERVRRLLEDAARRSPPAAIEVDGHADEVGSEAYNVNLSLRRAEQVRAQLLMPRANASVARATTAVPVTTRALGESCPIVPGGGHQQANRRVEVFVLDQGASVATPEGCEVGREEHTSWPNLPQPR